MLGGLFVDQSSKPGREVAAFFFASLKGIIMTSKTQPLFSAVLEELQSAGIVSGTLGFAPPGMQPTPCQQQQSPAHTAIEPATGSKYYVCATLPATFDAAGYAATGLTYTLIGKVQTFPEWDINRAVGTFQPIDGPVEKFDGTPNYGGGDAMIGDVVGDAGQTILKAAADSTTRAHVTIKVVRPDTATAYLDCLVSGWQLSQAQENTPYVRKCHIEICLAPVIVAAS